MKSSYKTKILQGHLRPIKDIKFSYDGTHIFSASSDRNVIKWDYKKGEKIFTYSHQASVNVICISKNNNLMFCGDSTGSIYIWDTLNNQLKRKIYFNALYNIRSIALSSDETYIIITFAERAKKSSSFISVYLVQDFINCPLIQNNSQNNNQEASPPENIIKKIVCADINTKFVKSCFSNENKNILVSKEDGVLEKFSFPEGELICSQKFHNEEILDFDINDEHKLIITSSKDGSMSLIDENNFQLLNKFSPSNPTRNLNACKLAIIPNPYYTIPGISKKISIETLFDVNNLELSDFNHFLDENDDTNEKKEKYGNKKEIILAICSGGQDSKFVTLTDQKQGGFEVIIYNCLSGEKIVDFLDHFGPVNSLAGFQKTLASGAEDATVRIHDLEHYLFEQ